MKKLGQYQKFDVKGFLEGKTVLIGAVQPRTGANGAQPDDGYMYVAKGFIVSDPANEGLNQGEAMNIKLKDVSQIKAGQQFVFGSADGQAGLVSPVGSVYGDFRNELSLKADKIGIHQGQQAQATARGARA